MLVVTYLNIANGPDEFNVTDIYSAMSGDASIFNKLTDKGCAGAPDWIIEVVSPDSRKIDYTTKLFKYRTSGVREYWLVDSEKSRVMVYAFYKDEMTEYSFTEDIPVSIFTDFSIRMSELEI